MEMPYSTSYLCLTNFCKCIIQLYNEPYLRRPTQQDVERITARHLEVHGFPGMLGSIDCMHSGWRNCPVAWFKQRHQRPKRVRFVRSVAGEQFTKGYYLADGIYPEWATLVKSFKCPMDPKTPKFKRYQEAARKDVERAFRVFKVVGESLRDTRVCTTSIKLNASCTVV
uniref:uncharacterized protein LOC122591850 n=1 Tax=Erigeron canadensis TaxID=72917 RepID=UPI001CB9D46C|nr:uncharacterized protein LOC122591850 [Erigeron canadensis]